MIVSSAFVFSLGGDAAICRIDFGYEYNHTPFMGSDLIYLYLPLLIYLGSKPAPQANRMEPVEPGSRLAGVRGYCPMS
jgi:hypothetical protein